MPGGATTIGGGLDAAHSQFPVQLNNPRSILLLTDGLQNTGLTIEEVAPQLTGIDINVIGYGTESSLDGELLSDLAWDHNGIYTRAMSPLHLKKFFSLAFGNIFENGVAVDPEFFLPEGSDAAAPMPFDVCGEENVTIVVGWDPDVARLDIRVTSPSGKIIQGSSPGVEQSTGRSWTFLRFALPHDGERDGQWMLQVFRARESRRVDVNYFVNVIVDGGPRLELMPIGRKYYTGDTINPLVALKYRDGMHPHHAKVEVEVCIPDAGVGNILTSAHLREPITVDADTYQQGKLPCLHLKLKQKNRQLVSLNRRFSYSTIQPTRMGLSLRESSANRSRNCLRQRVITRFISKRFLEKTASQHENFSGHYTSIPELIQRKRISARPFFQHCLTANAW